VAADETAQARPRLFRECRGQQDDGTERARLAVDRRVGAIDITPHLGSDKRDQKSEDDA
jgi:hypothetical protein